MNSPSVPLTTGDGEYSVDRVCPFHVGTLASDVGVGAGVGDGVGVGDGDGVGDGAAESDNVHVALSPLVSDALTVSVPGDPAVPLYAMSARVNTPGAVAVVIAGLPLEFSKVRPGGADAKEIVSVPCAAFT